ncbi:TetR/AcrR family transcriptional regulator [Euzebya sp.]|uniref:TetR/AcrR family transcriptional regulator n=1 Tax=Euzebya sp. TaxID=1971409 RepID=UPI003511F6CE
MATDPDYPDHTRVLQLLWRGEEKPSPRTGLTAGRVVAAAVAVADEAGLGALSMRRVAERLGVGTMSLYTYVPGRAELIPLMVDEVMGELPVVTEHEGWRHALESVADGWWAAYRRHPWLLEVPVTRPVLGPHAFDRYEAELRIIDGLGLSDVEMNAAVELVRSHVVGSARRAIEIARDAERSGISDDQWWFSVLPTLERVTAGREYPVAGRVGATIAAPHSDPRDDLAFGLARILDGLELLISSRRG